MPCSAWTSATSRGMPLPEHSRHLFDGPDLIPHSPGAVIVQLDDLVEEREHHGKGVSQSKRWRLVKGRLELLAKNRGRADAQDPADTWVRPSCEDAHFVPPVPLAVRCVVFLGPQNHLGQASEPNAWRRDLMRARPALGGTERLTEVHEHVVCVKRAPAAAIAVDVGADLVCKVSGDVEGGEYLPAVAFRVLLLVQVSVLQEAIGAASAGASE